MDQTIPQQLIDQFLAVVENGTEAEARAFLVDHLQEFPEESRNDIIAAFLEDAIVTTATDNALINAFKKEGLETARAMTATRERMDAQAKMDGLKKNI